MRQHQFLLLLVMVQARRAVLGSSLNGAREEGVTGKCLVLISPDAERSMNTNLSISETLSTEQLDADAIAASEYYYMEGDEVHSPTGRAAATRGREIAEAAGVTTSISRSDPGRVEFFRDGLQETIGERVNLVFRAQVYINNSN